MWSYNPPLSQIFGTPLSITQKHHNKIRLAFKKTIFNLEKKQNYVKRQFLTLNLKYGKKYSPIKVSQSYFISANLRNKILTSTYLHYGKKDICNKNKTNVETCKSLISYNS